MSVPLHTRMLTVRLFSEPGDTLRAEGRILDLRKRGVVPVAGRLQGPGIVHDMSVELRLARADLRILESRAAMSAYPFGGGEATSGEACPDILPNVTLLRGRRLDAGFGGAVEETIGGPRGCFHVFTLVRMLGPTVLWALERHGETALGEGPLFARSILVDGFHLGGLRIALRGSLFDIEYVPGAERLPVEEELAASVEVVGEIEVEVPSMEVGRSEARMREGGPGVERLGPWREITKARVLRGSSVRKGFTARTQELLEGEPLPVLHLFFALAPTLVQCMPSLFEELGTLPRRAEGPRAAVDSCHMWRAGGPLVRHAEGRAPSRPE
ncbi:MAG: hypothetical protein KatS3mg076_2824 [Candidatus Binatia bacterium]|nr:MAG: hypothetical protein KatS3mg076_2824 [Candidatus Binatia bacterium]